MLPRPGDSDDGDPEQDSEKHVGKHYPDSADEKPDDIHNCWKASGRIIHVFYFLSERPQSQNAQFKTLKAKGNANDSDAKH